MIQARFPFAKRGQKDTRYLCPGGKDHFVTEVTTAGGIGKVHHLECHECKKRTGKRRDIWAARGAWLEDWNVVKKFGVRKNEIIER